MPEFGSVLANGAAMLPEATTLVYTLAVLAGIVMCVWGVFKAKEAHESHGQRGTYRQAAYIIVSGVMLINASLALGIWSETLLGTPQEPTANVLSYDSKAATAAELSKQTLIAIIAFVQFVGLLAFVRGWFILPRIGERPDDTLGKALTHIIGGVLAVNVVTFAKITAFTFGIAALSILLDSI